jgi:hypothetical protein
MPPETKKPAQDDGRASYFGVHRSTISACKPRKRKFKAMSVYTNRPDKSKFEQAAEIEADIIAATHLADAQCSAMLRKAAYAADESPDQPQADQQHDNHGLSQDNPSTDIDIIAAAQEAARRLIGGQCYEDWKAVGLAARILRGQAMVEAGTNKPEGKRYAAAFSRKIADAKLDKILGGNEHKALRSRLLDLIDHIDAVEAWRATLPTNRRLELNYPITVWKQWQKSTVIPDPNKESKLSPVAKLKENITVLEEENHRLKDAAGGSVFTRKDRPRDIVNVLISTVSANKLKEIHKLLGQELKRRESGTVT